MLRHLFRNRFQTQLINASLNYRFCQSEEKQFNRIIVVRHGESIWNKENKWAGWTDVPLSSYGIKQAKQCAKIIKNTGLQIDEVYTSVLSRAIKTANYILDERDSLYLPIHKHWRLNEKHYGALQGEKKAQINEKYGQQIVTKWRMSMDSPPPSLDDHDNRHPTKDRKYKFIKKDFLPNSESLSDIIDRLKPLYDSQIKKKILSKKKLLIVAHGSSIRALFSLLNPTLDKVEIKKINIPSAIPLVISVRQNLFPFKIQYLGDESEIVYRMQKIKNETKKSMKIE